MHVNIPRTHLRLKKLEEQRPIEGRILRLFRLLQTDSPVLDFTLRTNDIESDEAEGEQHYRKQGRTQSFQSIQDRPPIFIQVSEKASAKMQRPFHVTPSNAIADIGI